MKSLGKLIRNRGTWVEKSQGRYPPDDFPPHIAIWLRKRTRKRAPLRTTEKIQIVHQVLVGKEYQTDVAREHRISNSIVCQLVRKAVKNR